MVLGMRSKASLGPSRALGNESHVRTKAQINSWALCTSEALSLLLKEPRGSSAAGTLGVFLPVLERGIRVNAQKNIIPGKQDQVLRVCSFIHLPDE